MHEQKQDEYEIILKGKLLPAWAAWFEGFALLESETGQGQIVTRLVGMIEDQSALHGVMNKIRSLNLELISLRQMEQPLDEDNLINQKGQSNG